LPNLPYSAELRDRQSVEFEDAAQRVTDALRFFLHETIDERLVEGRLLNVTVHSFKYQQVIGALAVVDMEFGVGMEKGEEWRKTHEGKLRALMKEAVGLGYIGWVEVAVEGFELVELKGVV